MDKVGRVTFRNTIGEIEVPVDFFLFMEGFRFYIQFLLSGDDTGVLARKLEYTLAI